MTTSRRHARWLAGGLLATASALAAAQSPPPPDNQATVRNGRDDVTVRPADRRRDRTHSLSKMGRA